MAGTEQVVEELEQAVDGLLYTSETDEPFEVVCFVGEHAPPEEHRLLELTGNPARIPVEVISLDDFLGPLTKDHDWHGPRERATVRKYQHLEEVIRRDLSDTGVFRIGRVELAIYVVGATPDGDWVGVRTRATET